RMPPNPPNEVTVMNDYSYNDLTDVSTQVLKVAWNQVTPKEGETITGYNVYRWDSVEQMQSNTAPAAAAGFKIAGPIPHQMGMERLTYFDNGTNAPTLGNNAGETFWYTIRAIDNSACGGNLSPNSEAVFGVLRDREGPPKPSGDVNWLCLEGSVSAGANSTRPPPGGDVRDPDCLYYALEATATSAEIRWIEFYAIDAPSTTSLIARVDFDPRGLDAAHEAVFCDDLPDAISAVVGTFSGHVSAPVVTMPSVLPSTLTHVLPFTATVASNRVSRPMANGDCGVHFTVPADPLNPSVNPIDLDLTLSAGTKEWRVYRRVNDGPLSLVLQGLDDFDEGAFVQTQDKNLPQNAVKLCYYLQVYDEHGNPSQMTRIGECFQTASKTPPPTPMLAPLKPEQMGNDELLSITWFSPPHNVERFHVWVGQEKGPEPPLNPIHNINKITELPQVVIDGFSYARYRTGKVGGNFPGGPQYTIKVPASMGVEYRVFVEAVAPSGQVGGRSNFESAFWYYPPLPMANVPWPARGLPAVNDPFDGKLVAEFVSLSPLAFQGGAIRIGEYDATGQPPGSPNVPGFERFRIPDNDDYETIFYRDKDQKDIFPCAIYRYQVA
ncbi:MAG: hypothetical protein AAF492_15590, partial [Verrucomicrobiota bacterium]